MILHPYGEASPSLGIDPDTEVYTMRLVRDGNTTFDPPLLCDAAWTTPREVYEHFWNDVEDNEVQYVKYDLIDYLRAHKAEVSAMNPIAGMMRLDFLEAYTQKYDLGMKLVV